jgi:hypothetical protein
MAADGCEVNTATDVNNCSGCGNACPARANATSACSGSACSFTCLPNYADCNGMAADGCEVAIGLNSSCGHCASGVGVTVPCTGSTTCQTAGGSDNFTCQ